MSELPRLVRRPEGVTDKQWEEFCREKGIVEVPGSPEVAWVPNRRQRRALASKSRRRGR